MREDQNDETRKTKIAIDSAAIKAVNDCAVNIFKSVLELTPLHDVIKLIFHEISEDLANAGILSEDCSLTDIQKTRIKTELARITNIAFNNYIKGIKKNTRKEHVIEIVNSNLQNIIDMAWARAGEELNRGAFISARVIQVLEGKERNIAKIKFSQEYDLNVPTEIVMFSSHFVELLKEGLKIDFDKVKHIDFKCIEIDKKTGEIIPFQPPFKSKPKEEDNPSDLE